MLGQEVEGDHAGLADRGGEQILAAEADAGAPQVGESEGEVGGLDAQRIDVDAERAGAAAGGGERDPAVAAAEVDQIILGADLREIEHALDQLGRGGDVGDVIFGLGRGARRAAGGLKAPASASRRVSSICRRP